jgi:hypothetical protein
MERLREALVARPPLSSQFYLEQLSYYYLHILVHMCQCGKNFYLPFLTKNVYYLFSGEYSKFMSSFGHLLKSDLVNLDESVARCCPELTVQWFYLLAITKTDDMQCSKLASAFGIRYVFYAEVIAPIVFISIFRILQKL